MFIYKLVQNQIILLKSNLCLACTEFSKRLPGFIRDLESPGILLWHFPGLESPGKRPLVLESSGNLLTQLKI